MSFKEAEAVDSRPTCSIYVRRAGDQIFTPLHLKSKTVAELLQLLQSKFGDDFKADNVGSIYQQNKRQFIFQLDDEMVDCIQPKDVFDIKSEKVGEEDEAKMNITLIELDFSS